MTTSTFRVLAALDFSALGDRALEEALLLCGTRPHSEVHVIVVGWDEPRGIRMPGPTGELLSHERADQAVFTHINGIVDGLRARGQSVTPEKIGVLVTSGRPAECICAFATQIDADMIIMGTHSRTGLEHWILGSVSEEVVRRAQCGVWVLRPRDFLGGERLPQIDPPLKAGEHSLKPFAHRHTYHYLPRADRSSTRILPAG